jgi:hypothetical protein
MEKIFENGFRFRARAVILTALLNEWVVHDFFVDSGNSMLGEHK